MYYQLLWHMPVELVSTLREGCKLGEKSVLRGNGYSCALGFPRSHQGLASSFVGQGMMGQKCGKASRCTDVMTDWFYIRRLLVVRGAQDSGYWIWFAVGVSVDLAFGVSLGLLVWDYYEGFEGFEDCLWWLDLWSCILDFFPYWKPSGLQWGGVRFLRGRKEFS